MEGLGSLGEKAMVATDTEQGTKVGDGRGQRGDRTYISRETIEEMVRESGLEREEKAAFVKVKAKGRNDCGIYYPKRNGVARVDLSGFTVDAAEYGVVDIEEDKRPTGRVLQEMNFEGVEEKDVLRNFKKLLNHLKHMKDEEVIAPRRGVVHAAAEQPAAKTSRAKKGGKAG